MRFLNYLSVLALLVPANETIAQNRWGTEFSFQTQSTRLGDYYVLNDPINDDFSYTQLKKSINLKPETGFTLRYYFSYKMAVCLGIFYSGHGQNYRKHSVSTSSGFYFSDYSWDHDTKLGYFKIPLTFQYESLPFKSASFFANGGVYFAFLSGFKDKDDAFLFNPGIYSSYDATSTEDGIKVTINAFEDHYGSFISPAYRSRDFGLHLAAGINFKISDRWWFPVSIQYQYGITNIKNEASLYLMNDPDSQPSLYWGSGTDPNSSSGFHTRAIGLKMAFNYRF